VAVNNCLAVRECPKSLIMLGETRVHSDSASALNPKGLTLLRPLRRCVIYSFLALVVGPVGRASALVTTSLSCQCRRSNICTIPFQALSARSKRGVRTAAIISDAWRCKAAADTVDVGEPVFMEPPEILRSAMRNGTNAVRRLLLATAAELPQAVVNWGSGGDKAYAVQAQMSAYLKGLFEHLPTLGRSFSLSPLDCFHGHPFGLPPVQGGDGEFGILFHCKEYPNDLPGPKGRFSSFSTRSPGYADRNVLYLASTKRMHVIRTTGKNHCLLLNLDIAEFLPVPAERVNAVDESVFYEIGNAVKYPDINYLSKFVTAKLRQNEGGAALQDSLSGGSTSSDMAIFTKI